MDRRRSRSSFRQAADLKVRSMGLPAVRARALRLSRAWRRVAGESLARHVAALEVRRGVLVVEADAAEWRAAVEPLLPRLAARLAAAFPDLGVKRFRLAGRAGERAEATPVPDLDPRELSLCDPVRRDPLETTTEARLTDPSAIAERYLKRARRRDQKP